MKISVFFKIFALSLFMTSLVSCKENIEPDKEAVEQSVSIVLNVDKVSLETADLRIRHDGTDDMKWVYMHTSDLETDADELIDKAVSEELEFSHEVLAYTGTNKSIRVGNLLPKTYYRLIVKMIADDGIPYGKAQTLLFRTVRNVDTFEVNDNWNVTYDSRTDGVNSMTNELVEYDNFKCTSTDEEPYILALIKASDYNSFQKHPDHKLKIRTFFEQYIASSGVSVGDGKWADIVETGDCIWQEQRLRHGDWLLFMVGVDENGELTGLYKQVDCNIPEETPVEDFTRWLGVWDVTGYNEGAPITFRLTIFSAEANLWFYSVGWEPNNIYMIDPATLPVEIFFDKLTGKAYLVSQYVSSAVDSATGSLMDFYFYGSFPYGGSNTFIASLNNKIAEIEMTNAANTEARMTALTFNTTQAGTQLSFKYTEVIYFMATGDNRGTAISMSHPDFPFTMKKVLE